MAADTPVAAISASGSPPWSSSAELPPSSDAGPAAAAPPASPTLIRKSLLLSPSFSSFSMTPPWRASVQRKIRGCKVLALQRGPSQNDGCHFLDFILLRRHNLKAVMREAVIIAAVRTPIGKFQGSLSPLSAVELGACVVREAVRRAEIDPAGVDEVIMGNVVSAGLGQNPARQAALKGGLDPRVAAMTINKVCGSGLKAVALAAQGIATGDTNIVVAGGMESMSNCPYLLPE